MQANKESNYHGRRGIAGAIRMVVGAASLLGCGQPPNTGSDVGAGPIGRVTVACLEMNSMAQVAARQQWMRLGLFP